MISLPEVVKRAMTGPICSENEFDMEILVPEIARVVDKYEIKYDPENPIPSDDDLADRVWKAAVEFYTNVGTYCTTSERRILFSANRTTPNMKPLLSSACPFGPVNKSSGCSTYRRKVTGKPSASRI